MGPTCEVKGTGHRQFLYILRNIMDVLKSPNFTRFLQTKFV